MSLYEALEGLVGAGVIAAAPACEIDLPPTPPPSGSQLFSLLRERGLAGLVTPVIDALSREIWTGRDERGMPRQISEGHVQALASILERHLPDAAEMVAAVEKARAGFSGHIGTTQSPSLSIAASVLARAKSESNLDDGARGEMAARFLLQRLFAHLLDDPGLLPAMKPALAEFLVRLAIKPATAPAEVRPGTPDAGLLMDADQRTHYAARGETGLIAQICQRTGLGPVALGRFLELLDRQGVRPEQRVVRLAEMAQWLKETRAHLLRPSNDEAEARRLKAKAAAALADGDFEGAMDTLKLVRRHVREGRRRIEERLQDEVAGLRAQMLEEALATARLAELALARLDVNAAVDLFIEAVDSLPSGDPVESWRLAMRLAEAQHRKGDEKDDAVALQQAAETLEGALKLLTDGKHAEEIAVTYASLGNVLALAGERDKGTQKLTEAATAYRRAIAGISADAHLKTLTHMRLGVALAALAERGGGATVYKEAAEAFRAALTGLDQETPHEWATALMGLGAALLGIDESESDRELLSEAGASYGEALTVLTRERNPQAWALAHTNLGNAHLGLGMAEGMSARLEDAVAAYRQALKIYTRESSSEQWALVQLNLGNALASLGDRDAAASSRHEEAVEAYNRALEVFTRESAPLRWAITQMNLGTALIRLGERGAKRHHWLAAAAAMVPALEVFEAVGANEYADLTRRNLRKFHEQWELLIGPDTDILPPVDARARIAAKAG